jgi:hypothetical protein
MRTRASIRYSASRAKVGASPARRPLSSAQRTAAARLPCASQSRARRGATAEQVGDEVAFPGQRGEVVERRQRAGAIPGRLPQARQG